MSDLIYKKTYLIGLQQNATPEPGLSAANNVLTSAPTLKAYRQLDGNLAQGRRTLFSIGLEGQPNFMCADGLNVNGTATRLCPPGDVDREVARHRVFLSPGCFPSAQLMSLPAGAVQSAGGGFFWNSGSHGTVLVHVRFTGRDGWIADATGTLATPASKNLSGSLSAQPHNEISFHKTDLIMPGGAAIKNDILARYSEDCQADFVIKYRGSPRVLTLNIIEEPFMHSFAHSGSAWQSANAYSAAEPIPSKIIGLRPQTDFPGDLEPRFGTHHALHVAENQRRKMGPCVFQWSSYDEDDSTLRASAQPAGLLFDNTQVFREINSTSGSFITSWALHHSGSNYFVPTPYNMKWGTSDSLAMLGKKAGGHYRAFAYVEDVGGSTTTFRIHSSAGQFFEHTITGTVDNECVEFPVFLDGDIYPNTPLSSCSLQVFVKPGPQGNPTAAVRLRYFAICADTEVP